MKQLDISTKTHPNTFALVDDEDYEFLNKWKWHASKAGDNLYVTRAEYSPITKKQIPILIHRLIMGFPEGVFIDHKDRNSLNNQKSNLRICTVAENAKNKKSSKGSSSKYLGVYFHTSKHTVITKKYGERLYLSSAWVAQIEYGGKGYNLGRFKTEIEAAKAYNNAASKHHGEFANLNVFTNQEVNDEMLRVIQNIKTNI